MNLGFKNFLGQQIAGDKAPSTNSEGADYICNNESLDKYTITEPSLHT